MNLTKKFAEKRTAWVAIVAMTVLLPAAHAQTQQGRAQVRAVIGSATYSSAGQSPAALKVGTVLYSGSTVKTAAESSVDLFLGKAAGVVRVTENTTLGIDKLTITDTGADSVIDTQLDLTEGTIRGNVNKLSAASKYEIKLPNGVDPRRRGSERGDFGARL